MHKKKGHGQAHPPPNRLPNTEALAFEILPLAGFTPTRVRNEIGEIGANGADFIEKFLPRFPRFSHSKRQQGA